ncbi:MAG: YncE family protein [Bryobacteraceae bacterium]
MKLVPFAAAAVFVVPFATGLRAQSQAPLKLVQSIPLPGLHDGDFDHFCIDLQGHRLFLTGEANRVVEVFDTQKNELIDTIKGLDEPHSMVYRGDIQRLFVVDGGASEVKVYDSNSFKLLGQIKVTIDADSNAYDPNTKYMYVVNGGREAHTPYSLISVIDTSSSKKLLDIKIDSNWVEALLLVASDSRMFANITGENAVGVVNRKTHSMLAKWPLPADTQQNVAFGLDARDHRLFVSTRKSPKLVVFDSDTGKVIAAIPCVAMVDDITYDPKLRRIYLAGDQYVDVFEQRDADHYALMAKVPGGFRAKTAILVPELGRYYLAVPRHGNQAAEVRVYAVQS